MNRLCVLLSVLLIAVVAGCAAEGVGNPRDVAGGTAGTLTIGGVARPDVQVNVFADATPPKRICYGVTDAQGAFTFIADDGKKSLRLVAGKYRIALESVAADPIPIPPTVSDPAKTTLVKDWTGSESKLELVVP
ncbi:MAG: hypothetical protein FJ302_02090 [Planctomycetes bacterium]|nr:hypothetical protein [Planctomycetota bacterium]